MFHEPARQFLYSAYRLDTIHVDDLGTTKAGVGTCFVVEGKPTVPWIVTNRHVVDIDYRQPTSKHRSFRIQTVLVTGWRADDSSYTFRLDPTARIFFHDDQENDVALIEPRFTWDGVAEDKRSLHWHFGWKDLADTEAFNGSLQPFDLVCYTGFPAPHDKLGRRPILRSGHIASDPRFDYSWDSNRHGSCVAYEGFSDSGASGSPVYAPARGARNIPSSRNGFIVGVNAGHVPSYPAGRSGISYFYKSTVVLEIMSRYGLM